MRELTYKEAAAQLNVSPATIKNWTRQGLLSTGKSFYPLESDIYKLKNELSSSDNKRLKSRANKSSATGKFIPSEYIEDKSSRKIPGTWSSWNSIPTPVSEISML